MTPTWKNTFNSSLTRHGWFHIAMTVSDKAGYPFFTWNGRVYQNSNGHDTGYLVSDLDGVKSDTLKDDLADK